MDGHGRIAAAASTAAVLLAVSASCASAAVSFQPAQPFSASAPWWSAAADVNGDGIPDIVTASNSSNVISALLGNGDGTLQAPRNTLPAPSNLNAVAAGDVNGDGKADVVAVVNGSPAGSMRVYISNGDGTFDTGTPYPVGGFPQDVVITQLDANGSPDIAVANQGAAPNGSVSVYLNNGSGTFTQSAGSPVTFTNQEPLGMGTADFDADGKNDLAVGANNGTNPGVFFLKGLGDGGFQAPVPLGGPGAQKVATGDVNGDGRPDMVAGRSGVGDVVVIKRTATGFDPPVAFDPDGPMGSANGRIALADLDGDDVLDLAVPNTVGPQASKVSIAIGHGDGTFETTSNEAVGGFPRQVAVADMNRDGHPDLATSNSGSGNVSVLLATPPAATVTEALDFGDVLDGATSAEKTITVRNDGAPRLRPGAVTIAGTDASQFAISSNTCTGANLTVAATCTIGVTFTPAGGGARTATVSIATNAAGSPQTVILDGQGLALGACANRFNGTTLADTIVGTVAGDRIFGFAGNDRASGLAGADCLSGGRGKDRLNGGTGGDKLTGGAGKDRLTGGGGGDRLTAGAGNDRLTGGGGRDKLTGGAGRDKLNGGGRRDTYRAGGGADTVNAKDGIAEQVNCGAGRDVATVDRKDTPSHCERVRRR